MSDSSVEYASSLESASPNALVYIDKDGRVQKSGRRRAGEVAYFGTVSGLIGMEAFLGYEVFGFPGLSIAVGLGALFFLMVRSAFGVRRAVADMVAGDLEGAEARLRSIVSRRLMNRAVRARAFAALAGVLVMQGRLDDAFHANRRALELYGRRKGPFVMLARYAEINLLARLGRKEEARDAFTALPPGVPDGEVLKLAYITTELLVAFKEGRHSIGDDVLHERASFALGITVAAPTLGLLSWAFTQSGDHEMAELMEREARERPGRLLETRLPEVAKWLDERPAPPAPEVRVALAAEAYADAEDEMDDAEVEARLAALERA